MQTTHEGLTPALFPRAFKIKTEAEKTRELNEYFAREVEKPARLIALRLNLARYSLDDRYYLQSAYKDRLRRPCGPCLKEGMAAACLHSKETARKYFWALTRTKKAV